MANTFAVLMLLVVDAAIWLHNLMLALTGKGFV
jgi:hypothetical protein